MFKHLLSTAALSLTLAAAAQAQTAPATTGNRTAGTTANPVDPTSKVGQQVSGTTGQGASNATPDRPAPRAGISPNTPTGNHTAGTTDNPVDPTSKVGQQVKGANRSTERAARKTTKTKMRTND